MSHEKLVFPKRMWIKVATDVESARLDMLRVLAPWNPKMMDESGSAEGVGAPTIAIRGTARYPSVVLRATLRQCQEHTEIALESGVRPWFMAAFYLVCILLLLPAFPNANLETALMLIFMAYSAIYTFTSRRSLMFWFIRELSRNSDYDATILSHKDRVDREGRESDT